jgi:GDPmannose 4,6-dehydratase
MKRALIVGSEGQDGRLLYHRLVEQGYAVLGVGRNSVRSTDGTNYAPVRITCREEVSATVGRWRPDEIYYLAAVHQSSEDRSAMDDAELFDRSVDVHLLGAVNILEASRELTPHAALFYAASSLVFGEPSVTPQDEHAPFRPRCIYGITKTAGVRACRYYRTTHRMHVSCGLMYNHESPLRRPSYVSQKIVRAAVAAAQGDTRKLVLGDFSARVDWAYAPDFIDAMTLIVRCSEPDDYVIATGETHTVQEFGSGTV